MVRRPPAQRLPKSVTWLFFFTTVTIITSALWLGNTGVYPVATSDGRRVLVPRQEQLRTDKATSRAITWLARRWGIPQERIYILVHDSEPWMQVLGLLDTESLSSARIWILNTSHKEGKGWSAWMTARAAPHEGEIYLATEYEPGRAEREVAARFYSTKTFWFGRPLGGLALIEDIRWTDSARRSGHILAYQSEAHLPSVDIPVKHGIPLKFLASQIPLH